MSNRNFKVFITFLLFWIPVFNLTAQTLTFTPYNSFPGVNRMSGYAFSLNGYGFVGGGYLVDSTGISDELWRFDPATDSWSQVASAPVKVRGSSFFNIGNKGYIVGGIEETTGGDIISNNTYEYDAVANSWTQKAPFPGVGIQYGIGTAVNGKGYVGSGSDTTVLYLYSDVFYEYDPGSDAWSQKANIPNPGIDQFVFVNNNGIFAGGGSNPLGNICNQYDITNDTWIAKNNFPFAENDSVNPNQFYFGGAVSFQSGSDHYLIGGTPGVNGSGSFLNVFKYDVPADSWSVVYSWPASQGPYFDNVLYSPYVFTVNNNVYFTMGFESSLQNYNDTYGINIVIGLEENDVKENIFIPALASDKINITVKADMKNLTADIFDLQGRLITSENIFYGANTVECNNFSDGIHLVSIRSENNVILSEKIMIISGR